MFLIAIFEQLLVPDSEGLAILSAEDSTSLFKNSNQKQNMSLILDLMGIASSKVINN